jgi:hypothetical protein
MDRGKDTRLLERESRMNGPQRGQVLNVSLLLLSTVGKYGIRVVSISYT